MTQLYRFSRQYHSSKDWFHLIFTFYNFILGLNECNRLNQEVNFQAGKKSQQSVKKTASSSIKITLLIIVLKRINLRAYNIVPKTDL